MDTESRQLRRPAADGPVYPGYAEERHHVDIDTPLGDRTVVDYETGKPMPFCVPTHENGRPTKAPGYYTDCEAALGPAVRFRVRHDRRRGEPR